MSKYKTGDKFVIQIGHGTVYPLYGARYFIKGFNTLAFDDNGLDRLERVNGGPTLRDAYDEGYEKGMRNAWECAKIIANLNAGEQFARFGVCFTAKVLDKFSASEAENRIVEYEAKQAEIKIGDEVRVDNQNCVVLVLDAAGYYCLLREDGNIYPSMRKSRMTKTGRHYDIESILEQLKGADDEV